MDKKLTLNINEDLIDFAHNYSRKTQQSISSIVEKFFTDLKGQENSSALPNKTSRLYGAIEGIDTPDKKSLRKLFHEKSIN